MWITRVLFEKLVMDASVQRGKAAVLANRLIAQDATIDWLKVRLTQLEYERATLINNYMGVKIPVPELIKDSEIHPQVTAEAILNATLDFGDIGDDAAKAQGLDWDAEGRLTQHGKLVQ